MHGTWDAAAETIDGFPYCVTGGTLWLLYDGGSGLGAVVLEFTR